MAYNASLTREQFMFSEMRITARLKQSCLSDKEILDKVCWENLYQYPTEREIRRKCLACLKRLKAIENMPAVIEALVNGTVGEAKQATLIAMMLQSQLLAEFMVIVIGNKYRTLDLTITRKDMNVFFYNLQQSDENVATWSETTINKLKVVFRTCLREAGYINGVGNDQLYPVYLSDEFIYDLKNAGLSLWLPAFNVLD